MHIRPCSCGGVELTIWHNCENSEHGLSSDLEKIECPECGNFVEGSGEDCINDWNSERYNNNQES